MAEFEGYMSDRVANGRRPVCVRIGRHGLELCFSGGHAPTHWAYRKLRFVGAAHRGEPVRLTSTADRSVRLVIEDPDSLRQLFAAVPHLRPGRIWSPRTWIAGGAVAVVLLVGIWVLGLGVTHAPAVIAPLIPVTAEVAIGEAATHEFAETPLACTDKEGSDALARLTDRLAETVETPYPFTIRVANVEEANAFAAPGGHIVLFKGLLDYAEGPAEIAGVLAHEMAHVVLRHPTEQAVRTLGLGTLFQMLIGDSSVIRETISDVGVNLLALAYSRSAEVEADAMAVVILNEAGIDSAGLTSILERLALEDGMPSDLPTFLSTHPPSDARAKALRTRSGSGQSAMSAQDWAALKLICRD